MYMKRTTYESDTSLSKYDAYERHTHMSVMFSISASLCRIGNALMPRSGSMQDILVLLQEQEVGHTSVDIHGSP